MIHYHGLPMTPVLAMLRAMKGRHAMVSFLDRLAYLARRFPRLALGSSGAFSDPGTPQWWNRIAAAMRCLCNTDGMPIVKLHGLRMLDPVLFSHIPFASADSCNVARNIGIDSRWSGTYMPSSKTTRAVVLIDRIESHASASRWNARSAGVQQNMELLG